MNEVRAAALEALWRDPTARSRNRHYDEFQDRESAHARRVVLYLLAVRAEIASLPEGAVRATRGAFARGTARLAYESRALGLRRIAYLTEHELSLLIEDPQIAARLRWAAEEPA